MVPRVSSENRFYVPCGFIDKNYVVGDSSNVIYEAPLFIFTIISSRMHLVWFKHVSGRLENSLRYSTNYCYNPFPFPNITEDIKINLNEYALLILDEREKYSELSLSQMYDPKKMPLNLKSKHEELDTYVESLYEKKVFKNDDDRIKYLFSLYAMQESSYNLI